MEFDIRFGLVHDFTRVSVHIKVDFPALNVTYCMIPNISIGTERNIVITIKVSGVSSVCYMHREEELCRYPGIGNYIRFTGSMTAVCRYRY